MNWFLTRVVPALLLFLVAGISRADLIYHIDIDTSLVNGSAGFIELSLGGLADSPLAQLDLIAADGDFGAVVDQFGNVSGALGGSLMLASNMGLADLLQEAQFVDSLLLQLRFSGDWLNNLADAGVSFAIKLWSTDFLPLLTDDAAGDLLRMELIPGGQVQLELPSDFVRVRPLAVPAPAVLPLLGIGLMLMLAVRSRLGRKVRHRR